MGRNTRGVIYYTDNKIEQSEIYKVCQDELRKSFSGEIIVVSLKPVDFGSQNIVLGGEVRSYPTMIKQIITALEYSTADNVFFCEHDVLYNPSHFDFNPPRPDVFYYNSNVWRWLYGSDTVIRHDRMLPLSAMCANRLLALDNYRIRQKRMEELGLDKFRSREPRWGRRWGYEPGTKKKRRGGITDDDFEVWESAYPIIDIRHRWSFSSPKVKLEDFRHKPKWWEERGIEEIWSLASLFQQGTRCSSGKQL